MSNSVAVIIPCFNSGSTLEETIASIKAQTYKNLEIIIVDDGSTEDETVRILDALDRQSLRLIRFEENCGLPSSRNAGIRASRSEYVILLDADDRLAPRAIHTMMDRMNSDPDCNFVFSDIQMFGDKKGYLRCSLNPFQQLFVNKLPYALLVKKRAWANCEGYDESLVQGYEDWAFNLALILAGFKGLHVSEPLLEYRVSQDGMLLSKSRRMHFTIWAQLRKRFEKAYSISGLKRAWVASKGLDFSYHPFLLLSLFLVGSLLPQLISNLIFSVGMRFSHSSRVSTVQYSKVEQWRKR